MAFITDKEKLKSGLIIFRRGDVAHRNFYCRIKLPKEDRYKTIALGTADRQSAHDQAFDLDADIRFRIKHDVPVFNRPFRQVAEINWTCNGLVPVTCLSLCHLSFKSQGAYAAQI
jgi:integrase